VVSERDGAPPLNYSVRHLRSVVRRHPTTLPPPFGILGEVRPLLEPVRCERQELAELPTMRELAVDATARLSDYALSVPEFAIPRVRIVTATVRDGRVGFNQVVMEQEEHQPAGVFLAAWDQDRGVYAWMRGQADVEKHSTVQAAGYSRCIGSFALDAPPQWLGEPTFLPKELFDPWEDVEQLSTNAKRAAIVAALNKVLAP